MRIHFRTEVAGEVRKVFSQFDKSLLVQLTPPGTGVKFIEFGGNEVGDIVHIEVTMLGIFKQVWYNQITEHVESDTECYFVDEGVRLPSVLKQWRHKHLIRKSADGKVEIVDDITYKSPFFLLDWLMWPVMAAQFLYRKPVYRRIFGKA